MNLPLWHNKTNTYIYDNYGNKVLRVISETSSSTLNIQNRVVAACNYHERMKEVLRMLTTDTLKVLPDGKPIFSVRMAMRKAKDLLKELEDQQ